MARIRRFHRRGRGSIPRKGAFVLNPFPIYLYVQTNFIFRCHSEILPTSGLLVEKSNIHLPKQLSEPCNNDAMKRNMHLKWATHRPVKVETSEELIQIYFIDDKPWSSWAERKSGWPSGLRRQTQEHDSFRHGSILVHVCGRGFESHFWQIFLIVTFI